MGARNPFEFTIREGMQRGMRSLSPLPTRLVSNEEYNPLPPTPAQRRVEQGIAEPGGAAVPPPGGQPPGFPAGTGGMAAAFLAMNEVFGEFFAISPVEAAEPAAFEQLRGPASPSSSTCRPIM